MPRRPLLALALLLALTLPSALGRVLKEPSTASSPAPAVSLQRLPDGALSGGDSATPMPADAQPSAALGGPEEEQPKMGTRIINGTVDSQQSRFPYAALILADVQGGNCTGSLIAPSVVLTAAHCLVTGGGRRMAPQGMAVRIQEQWHDVAAVHMHSGYRPGLDINTAPKSQPLNDIGIIILSQPSSAPTVRLPEAAGQPRPAAGDVLLAAGFGLTENNTTSDELRYTSQTVFPASDCQFDHPDNFCAGRMGSSTCNGDSGGPVVDDSSAVHVLVGVTSFGDMLCQELHSYFTRVQAHLDWIEATIATQGLADKLGAGGSP